MIVLLLVMVVCVVIGYLYVVLWFDFLFDVGDIVVDLVGEIRCVVGGVGLFGNVFMCF